MTKKNKSRVRIGSLNCQSLNKYKKQDIVEDMDRHNLLAIATQETKIKGQSCEYIKARNGKKRFIHYYSGTETNKNYYGVGILVREGTMIDFTPINERICKAEIKMESDQKLVLISALAPTLDVSEKKPETRQEFYDTLDQIIQSVSNRDLLVVAGDFNAKTGDAYEIYPRNMGNYGLGLANSNGYTNY